MKDIVKPLRLLIVGEPKNKQHARVGVRNGKIMMFQPKQVHEYSAFASAQALKQLPKGYVLPANDTPLGVEIRIFWPMPKSWSRRKREEYLDTLKCTKPDADNLAKAILDPLSGIVWVDDCQVHLRGVYRWWCDIEEVTVEMIVQEIDESLPII
jgi:Holliday junction resolvase RusA-like endonuclease